ncbi:NUDIX domain-containing protein [Jhaorihella thermophila]
MEPGETAMQAAARELAEETGVIARPVEYLTNVDVLRHDGSGRLVAHYLLAAVLCDYRRGAPVAADDVTDAAWFDVKTVRARELPMSANVAEVMELGIARVQARRCAESQASTAADSR